MSTVRLRHPPGRGGRMWLQRRLAAARRGVRQLDLRLQVLRGEQQRLDAAADAAGHRWGTGWSDVRRWELRAAAIGGQRGLRAGPVGSARVDVGWTSVMGIRVPGTATLVLPGPVPTVASTAAVPQLVLAVRAALDAAVQAAVAQAAARVVTAEVATTRVRLRALEHRWVPRLEQALADVEDALEEQERSEGVLLRAARQDP